MLKPIKDRRAVGEVVRYAIATSRADRDPAADLTSHMSCCRFRGHEDKIVTKELESEYDKAEVQP